MGMIMSPAMAATGQYFNKNRGAAMGLAVAGSSLGGVVWPIALGKMLYNPHMSFGWTVRITGFVMLALTVQKPPLSRCCWVGVPHHARVVLTILLSSLTRGGAWYECRALVLPSGHSQCSFFLRKSHSWGFGRQGRSLQHTLCGWYQFWDFDPLHAGPIQQRFYYRLRRSLWIYIGGHCIRNVGFDGRSAKRPQRNWNLYGHPIDGAFLSRYGGFNEVSIFSGIMTVAGSVAAFLAKATTEKGLFGTV
jgi:MFS family permease